MLFNLILVLFLSSGERVEVPLKRTLTSEYCADLRDIVRSDISNLNDMIESGQVDSIDNVDFVDAECNTEKIFY